MTRTRSRSAAVLAAAALALFHAAASAQRPRLLSDTITAVASRTTSGDAARAVSVLTRAMIERSTARNVAELLAFQLGVDVFGRSAAQADISLRGSTAEQTLVLVDGVRVSDAQSAHYALDLAVPLGAIERIEILRGGGSALYGPDAVGGVINIVTRHAAMSPSLAIRGGAFGTLGGSGLAGTQLGSLDVTTSAEYEHSDGFRMGTDHRIGQGRVALRAPLGNGRLSANIGLGIRDFGANTFYGPYNSVERTGSATADAKWSVPLGAWSLTTAASTRRHTDHFTLVRENPALYQNDHASWQHTGELVARTGLGAATLAVGADAEKATLRSARLGDHDEWREAGFAEMSWGGPLTTVDLGARADHSSIYGGFFSPSLALSRALGEGARLHGSVNRGFRAPTWTERYYVDPANQGNPDLFPERFWSGDLGARIGHSDRLTLDITLFARHAEQLIDWVKPAGAPAGTKWVATNVGNASYRGLEQTLTLPRLGRFNTSLSSSVLSFTDDQGTGLSGKYALRPITRQVTAHVGYTASPALRASVELLSARRATEDSYLTGNLRLEWHRRNMAVTVDLTNFTDARWLDASGMDVAGRGVYVGLRWR